MDLKNESGKGFIEVGKYKPLSDASPLMTASLKLTSGACWLSE
jgi:hypothetical protein